ncbi:MAG: hypothetical protein KGZ25_14975 [Planctomycetes bacterium]|nr:hypothetical protein [Planctomycetota bacterium]
MEVCKFCAAISELKFKLTADGPINETSITCRNELPIELLLDVICYRAGVYWEVKNGAIHFVAATHPPDWMRDKEN